MTDEAINIPPRRINTSETRSREGLYQRFLSWMSMSKPGLWRLRIDIMVINYAVLFAAAILAPILLQPIAGIEKNSSCGGDTGTYGTCADSITVDYNTRNVYAWTSGFSVDDIMWTTIVFIIASFILTIIWAFFVSRGTRLRGLVVRSSAPGFLVVLAVLLPMVILPLFAGLGMFIVTHGGDVMTVFTGVTDAVSGGQSFEIAFPGYRHNQYSERMFAEMLAFLFIFGGLFAFIIAISMKIILADGVMGLVKSIVIAGILATITVAIGLFVFEGDVEYATPIQLGLLLAFGIAYYLWFRMSLFRNKRSKVSRTVGLSFTMYWIGWFPLICLYFLVWLGYEGEVVDPWLILWGCAALYALFLSFTFRDISRINLLPQP